MRERIIRLPKALPHQLPVLLSPARFKMLVCGRRWGKTALGLQACVDGHGPKPAHFKGAVDGGRIWWVAPSYGVAHNIIWPDLKRALRDAHAEISETQHSIALPGGGSITVRSADNPDNLRGVGLDGVVLDEAAFMDPRVWGECLRPALADKQGWAIFCTTPNGANWLHDLFQDVPNRSDWARWQRPTTDNPLIPARELEEQREKDVRAYAQEYEAQFVNMAGAEFSADYFRDSIWYDDAEFPPPDQIRFRAVALDPSLGETDRSDFSAFAIVALDYKGTMWVDADIRRRDASQIVNDGLELCRRFQQPPALKLSALGIETNQFQKLLAGMFAERSKAQGLMVPLHGIHNSEKKQTRIRQTLTPYLSRGSFRFRRNSAGAKLLVSQLRAFPVDKHDDGPDALEMAVRLTQYLFSTDGGMNGGSKGPTRVFA